MAMQRNVVPLREVNPGLLGHGGSIQNDAKRVTSWLVSHKTHDHTSVLLVTVRLRHKDRLPGQFAGNILSLPLKNFMGLVILLRESQHPVVVNDAPAESLSHTVDLGVDLGLVEAVVGPAGAGALTSPEVHCETSYLSATASPVFHISRPCLTQRKANWRFIVANHIQVDNVTLLEGIDDMEKEERIGLEDTGLLPGFSVDDADGGSTFRFPGVVVIQVALVDTVHQPLRFGVQHAIPVQWVWDLNHHDVLLRQADGVHRRRVLSGDASNKASLHRSTQLLRAVRLHREDDILRLQSHILWANAKLDGASDPFSCGFVHVWLSMEDQGSTLH
mmetsp:Transcript_3364/g.7866  ORF Transcript_3364/g.7866 Transcript_3364/m.7866 type:complete len:332 (+) Transcript_3364:101-1096(+)